MPTITAIEDYGSVVRVYLDDGNAVNFEHRAFHQMAEARGGALKGEEVVVVKTDDGEVLRFADEEVMEDADGATG
jgi:hypothetical protein